MTPIVDLPRYWGFCMNGKENIESFSSALQAASLGRPEGIRYLEIGLGNCGTINSVDFILNQLPGEHRIVGIEHVSWTMAFLVPYRAELIIRDAHQVPDGPWDVVFIDACHCKQCVVNDFNSIRDAVVPGGFVIFHDTSPEFQGMHANMSDMSEHQKNGIEVLAALEECDLSGFKLIADTPGHYPEVDGLRIYQKT